VLLDPEGDEQLRYPDPDDSKTVEAGVTGGADGDQPVALIDARLPMMHMEVFGGTAGAALVAVTL
jgi:hypothetical protein